MISWANTRGIQINFIQPGNPQQNAYIERYNRTVRYDWLGQHLFTSLDELQNYATRCNIFNAYLILLIASVKNGGITALII
ncbi:hypothetical protein GCM10009413_15870 [Tatumella punctata]